MQVVAAQPEQINATLSPEASAAVHAFLAAIPLGANPDHVENDERSWEIPGYNTFSVNGYGVPISTVSLGFWSLMGGDAVFEGVNVERNGEGFNLRFVQTLFTVHYEAGDGNLEYANDFLVRMAQRYLTETQSNAPAAPEASPEAP